jgi:hypothetical protein
LAITFSLILCCGLFLFANQAFVQADLYSASISATQNGQSRLIAQATRAPNSYNHNDDQDNDLDDIDSISRFDMGEQIRAPLLKPPTTLAPLAPATTTVRLLEWPPRKFRNTRLICRPRNANK